MAPRGFTPYEDDLENNVDFQTLCRTTLASLTTRKQTIRVLRRMAKTADAIHKGCSISNRDANITGAIGGGLGAAAGVVAIVSTGGIAAPFVISTCAGGVFSFGGGAWSLMNEIERDKRMSDLKRRLMDQIAKDNKAMEELDEIFYRIKDGNFGEPYRIFRLLHMTVVGVGTAAAADVLKLALPPILYFLAAGTQKIILPLIQLLATEALKSTEATAMLKIAFEISKKAAEKSAKKTAKKAAEKTGKKVAEKVAEKAVTTAAKEGMKTTARVTGAVSVSFGVLTSLWEGYNAYQNHYASQEESQLGKELRDLANDMESRLELIYNG